MVDHHSVCAQLPSRISLRHSGFSELKRFGARHDRQPQCPPCLYGEKRLSITHKLNSNQYAEFDIG